MRDDNGAAWGCAVALFVFLGLALLAGAFLLAVAGLMGPR